MTWLLPTLVAASLGGADVTIDILPQAPLVLAQTQVPSKGGEAAAPSAPSATEGGGEGGPAPEGPGMGSTMLIMGLIFVFFWLFFIRPQNKQMKEHQKLVEGLKSGDPIVTQGGMFGRITGFDDTNNAVILEIAKDVKIKVLRNQIAKLQGSDKKDAGQLKGKAAKG